MQTPADARPSVRAVKEMDSKSIGLCPRRFESCTCREIAEPVIAQLAERLTVAVYTQIPSIGHRFDSGKPEIQTHVESALSSILQLPKLQEKGITLLLIWKSQCGLISNEMKGIQGCGSAVFTRSLFES